MKTVQKLLASTNKLEVLEAMEFFRVCYEYKFDAAESDVSALDARSVDDLLCFALEALAHSSDHISNPAVYRSPLLASVLAPPPLAFSAFTTISHNSCAIVRPPLSCASLQAINVRNRRDQ
ncbi:hypothetical protein NUW54_g12577 [Trametes sanguinea]|uniref:Uncharacterized protein n=1 Tax=Trametes sanguinea TaxID=158606 RepID=A0ACC1MXX9_9APHY|nr:hypothetical protein NUW54_g12577 [Trametes sanguinea]